MNTTMRERIAFFERVVRDWLESNVATVACGTWRDGAIAELIPRGNAELLPAAYTGRFAGVREIRLSDAAHHIHFDLGRVEQVVYALAPCVCFGGRPSFEVRLGPRAGVSAVRTPLLLMLTDPYKDGALDRTLLETYFAWAREHIAQRPDLVAIEVAPSVQRLRTAPEILAALRRLTNVPVQR